MQVDMLFNLLSISETSVRKLSLINVLKIARYLYIVHTWHKIFRESSVFYSRVTQSIRSSALNCFHLKTIVQIQFCQKKIAFPNTKNYTLCANSGTTHLDRIYNMEFITGISKITYYQMALFEY